MARNHHAECKHASFNHQSTRLQSNSNSKHQAFTTTNFSRFSVNVRRAAKLSITQVNLLLLLNSTMSFNQYFGLGLLFSINTVNFLDRISVASVLDDIKKSFEINQGGAGFLSSCFLLGFMLTAPIFGYLGDKYSRKWILVGGISFWCAAAFSGSIISKEYKALFFISRMLVGVGEASYSTIAPTIIADLFPANTRKMALSIFYFAIPIGTGLGFFVGQLAIQLGDWRWIFRITPTIGVVCVLLLLVLKEPIRGQSEGNTASVKDNASVLENIKYLYRIKSYLFGTIGFTCCLFATGALSWWSIVFFQSARGDSYATQARLIFGIVVASAGFVGVILGSAVAQIWRKSEGRADPLVCAIGVFLAVPFTMFALISARNYTNLSWFLMFLSVTCLSTNWAVISDMLLSVVVPSRRAFATAIQILVSHLFGDASSPFIVGQISDFLRDEYNMEEHDSLLYSLTTLLAPLSLGAITFVHCSKYFVQDVENCKTDIDKNKDDPSSSEQGSSSNTRLNTAHLTDFATMSA